MKLTKKIINEVIDEVIAENDGHPKILQKNGELGHNWSTHMEWKSSTDKKKYGTMIGEVIHHTLYEDGSITNYDVKFGDRIVKNIPANRLESVNMQEHSHSPTNAGSPDDEEKNGRDVLHGDKEMEEGWLGGLGGAWLAKPHGANVVGKGPIDFEDMLRMGAGGYFGHKVQNYLSGQGKEKKPEKEKVYIVKKDKDDKK